VDPRIAKWYLCSRGGPDPLWPGEDPLLALQPGGESPESPDDAPSRVLIVQVLGEAVIASNVLMAGGTGTVAVQTAQEAPGFKDVVAAIVDSPANPAVLFDADPGNWR
jgi:hypothetical protein